MFFVIGNYHHFIFLVWMFLIWKIFIFIYLSLSFFFHSFQEADTEKIFYGLDDIKEASDIIIVRVLHHSRLRITSPKVVLPDA